MTVRWKRTLYLVAGFIAAGLLALAFLPDPVPVDVASVQRGALAITVDEDGETRARDRYVISAPVAGRVPRIDLREGDHVATNQVVAEILPLPLSARERDEQLARITATEALSREARERVRHAATDYEQAMRERSRQEKLLKDGFVSSQAVEQARVAETTSADELAAARFRGRSAAADAKVARAALMAIEGGGRDATVSLRSPVAGQVLRVPERSERVVMPGTALMIVGDSRALEIVVDVLSGDAVKIKPGMAVRLEGWGEQRPLQARVRLVEPYAFTKVSALGVEEQRVNVIADFVDAPQSLGDAYRVEARIVLWSSTDALKIPSNALFRKADGWAVFIVDGHRARVRPVRPGHAGPLETEIVEGLGAGDRVVLHPSNDIGAGTRIRIK
ncbi:MAG: efflux RND transporter periplasmic adaptor subunit [Betaproteobacteria bacterium]|jgi:HlyD family secretion protein